MSKNVNKLCVFLIAIFSISPMFASSVEDGVEINPVEERPEMSQEEQTVLLFETLYEIGNGFENRDKSQNDALFDIFQEIIAAKPLHHILACVILADLPNLIPDLEEKKQTVRLDRQYEDLIWSILEPTYAAAASIDNESRGVLRDKIIDVFADCADQSSIKGQIPTYRSLFKEDKDLKSALGLLYAKVAELKKKALN